MNRVSRRRLLQGLGAGTALFSPFLQYRSAEAQATAPAGNLIIFFTPNGHKRSLSVNNAPATPQFDGITPGTNFTLGPSLMPLQPFQSNVAVIRGLNSKTPTFIASHQDICRILTCKNAPGGQSAESMATQFLGYGPSIDQSIGMAINQRPLVVAVDPYRSMPHWRTMLVWRSSMVNEPFVKDFNQIFTTLFGAVAAPQTPAQMAALLRAQARDKSILDLVQTDIATFRTRVSTADRIHLDTYLDSIRAVEQRVASTSASSASCSNTSALQTRISAMPPAPIQNDDKSPPGVVSTMLQFGQLHMDLIATGMACGTNRIAVIQWQGASEGYDVGANTGSPDHHSVSHYSFGASSGQRWVAIDTWYAQQFAYLMNSLKTLNVLDNTMIVWVTEIAEGHNQTDMVTVVGGGKALGLKLGQYIVYPVTGNQVEGTGAIPVQQNPKNRGLGDLWVTVQQAMGVNSSTFGDPQWIQGPLTELRS
jgi:hypothetical protein